MAIPEYIELFDSGSGGLTTNDKGLLEREVSLRWLVNNKLNYPAAEAWATEQAPLTYKQHRRTRIDIRSLGNKWWEVTASYTNAEIQPEEGGGQQGGGDSGSDPISNTISIDTTGGTEHITQANTFENAGQTGENGQIGYPRPGTEWPDMEGALNVEGDQVRGIDVTVPVFNFSETWTFPSYLLVDSYIATLYELTGTINNNKWRVFDTGEVLFLGARTEITRGASASAVTFSFQVRPTMIDFSVGTGEDKIININKGGWDYMQVTYDTVAKAGSIVKIPKCVYISSVYQGKDFTRLLLGNKFPAVYLNNTGFQ